MTYDAIIIGAGHNGLVAGIILADAGWKVLVLEAQSEPGGCVRTADVTLPGFKHDIYATNLNGFAGSAFVQKFGVDLKRHGFEFIRAEKGFGSLFPDGEFVGVSTSQRETEKAIARLSAHDAAAWAKLIKRYNGTAPRISALLRAPMPSWPALRAVAQSSLEACDLIFGSAAGFVRRHFAHPKMRALWAAWAMHLDFAPNTAGGALYPFVQCMLVQQKGLQIGKGGARAMIEALVALLKEKGGELRCSSRVDEVVTKGRVATGVVTKGEYIAANRAVIANLTPNGLFGRLVKTASSRLLRKVKRFRHGPGTMMIHLALTGLPDWINPTARAYFYVHVAPSLEQMSRAYADAALGLLPKQPVLIVAQPTVVDPGRAPLGQHILSVQVRVVPAHIDWDNVKEAYADQLIELLESYAPGLRAKIVGRHVMSPADIERANPNLVGGDNLAGSHHLSQQFIFRPFLGWSRYKTPVDHLHLCGASTWPGAGVGGASGWILGHLLSGGQ